MPSKITIAKGGTHFLLTCTHCRHERKELVNPDLNKNPFAYQAQCTGCGETLDPDFIFISEVQASFSRAMQIAKKTTQSTEAMGGARGGDKTAGSPAYSAYGRTDAEFTQTPRLRLQLVYVDGLAVHRGGEDTNQGETHVESLGNR